MKPENKKITNPLLAIRKRCLDCCCYQEKEVRLCPAKDCPLYDFRFGKNPYHTMKLTDDQRKKRSERMRVMWEMKKQKKEKEEN